MLLSISLIVLISLLFSQLLSFIKLPRILGMLVTGVILGPFALGLIHQDILNISTDLRQIALIVILIRAGLSLDLEDLKTVGRPALLLSFIPASIEILAITICAPIFFEISYLEAAMMGAVVAAVSPAVVVPRMIQLIKMKAGEEKKIPQMILASASVDDIFVIVIFTSLLQMYQGQGFSVFSLLFVPLSILIGAMIGIITGVILMKMFKAYHMRDTIKVLIIFSAGFLMIALEQAISDILPISGLVAVMLLGVTILKTHGLLAKRLVSKFEKIWVIAEIMLFVLVGAAVDISVVPTIGIYAILLIMIALVFRMMGVFISLFKTNLNQKEKMFVGFSYIPKATVQAAIGAIPLAFGLPSGQLILTVAVLAILMTAPLGAILIDKTALHLLN